MAKNKTAPVETPVEVVMVNGNVTRLGFRGVVVEVQHDRTMGTRQLVAAVPVPADQEEAIRTAAADAADERYHGAASKLVADEVAEWVELEATLREWRDAAASKRAEADQKRAAAAELRGRAGRTREVVALRSEAEQLERAAALDDQGADDTAGAMNDVRERIGVTLRVSQSSLVDAAAVPDDAAAKAMAKLAGVLTEVLPVLYGVHAVKVAKSELVGAARTDFLDELVPRVPRTADPEAAPIPAPTRHPVAAPYPAAVRVANPAGGFMTPDEYSDENAGTPALNSRGRPLPDGIRYARPDETE